MSKNKKNYNKIKNQIKYNKIILQINLLFKNKIIIKILKIHKISNTIKIK